MKYYIIAGEKSGDDHGAKLISEIKKLDDNAEFRGIGGDEMIQAGLSPLYHFREIGVMGFWEVLKNIISLYRIRRSCFDDIVAYHPHLVVLIDSGGFNLPVARFANKRGYKVLYFIPPKVWAWGAWRISKLRKYVDLNVVTLPFELSYFTSKQLPVAYYGSPVLNRLTTEQDVAEKANRECIGLMPGSREQEVKYHLPTMLQIARSFPQEKFVIGAVRTVAEELYQEDHWPSNVAIEYDNGLDLLKRCKAAIVVSGTATLEACILRVPQVVVYKTHWLNYLIGRFLISVKMISLVNLIADRRVVTELIQQDFTPKKAQDELRLLLENTKYRNQILSEYDNIKSVLGTENAYKRVAGELVSFDL